MALFGTVYDGVRAAIAMQQATDLAEREQECPALGLRIGVNVGDVVDDGSDDVFSSAVVLARRLCDAAGPRKILVSEVGTAVDREPSGCPLRAPRPHSAQGLDRTDRSD
jgi:class 3 adenylate cyclase